MSGGYILIHRSLLDHHVFSDEPYCERMAWVWLLTQASYQPHTIRYHNQLITVGRGEVPTSYRKLKEAFRWGNQRVAAWLAVLELDGMLTRKTGTGFLIITICNYDKYQDGLTNTGTQPGTRSGTESGTQPGTNRKNINKGKEIKEEDPRPACVDEKTWKAFLEMRVRIKKPMSTDAVNLAYGKLEKFHAAGHDPTEIMNYSIMNSYPGLYEPKEKNYANTGANTSKNLSKSERARAAILESATELGYADKRPAGEAGT